MSYYNTKLILIMLETNRFTIVLLFITLKLGLKDTRNILFLALYNFM